MDRLSVVKKQQLKQAQPRCMRMSTYVVSLNFCLTKFGSAQNVYYVHYNIVIFSYTLSNYTQKLKFEIFSFLFCDRLYKVYRRNNKKFSNFFNENVSSLRTPVWIRSKSCDSCYRGFSGISVLIQNRWQYQPVQHQIF